MTKGVKLRVTENNVMLYYFAGWQTEGLIHKNIMYTSDQRVLATQSSCTLYLDSSGDPGWPSPFGKSAVTWYVVSGIVLTPEADRRARQEIEAILREYIPDSIRRSFPPDEYEVHYHYIIRGDSIYKHLTRPQLKELADKVFALIRSLNPVLFSTAIQKTQLKRKYGSSAWNPKILGITSIIHRYSMYLDREEKIGNIIMDEEEYKKDKALQHMVHEFRRTGITIRGSNYNPRYDSNLENIPNAPSFTSSYLSSGIQLADVIARTTWQHYEHTKSNRFQELTGLWDKNSYRTYEPSVVPAPSQWI